SDSSELSTLRPLNMYGYSKHMFELYAKQKGISDKITGLKYFNVFGFGEAHKGDMRSVVLKGYEQIKSMGVLNLFKSYRPDYKDGEQKRDFLYVKDAARITLYLLLERKYGLYNVGRGVAETWNDLGKALFKALNLPTNIHYTDMPESLRPKYQYYTKADTEKLLKTGYSDGFTSLEEAVEDYVNLLQA
ncbi:MAG TPA: NAD-dependent epimerase/dehydratase family protein, partial [Leptospiraceae bacterium]|nr:NAD-dependent epimerase/dehydratase family protein [Leptospiraceae bacterium]